MTVSTQDFIPSLQWTEDSSMGTYPGDIPLHLIEESTGNRYLNEYPNAIRAKFLFIALAGTPVYHTGLLIMRSVFLVAKIARDNPLWYLKEEDSEFLKEKLKECSVELLEALASPLYFFALEVSALYGMYDTNNGRKVFASLERNLFDENQYLAPCFQPNATRHFFGGSMTDRISI